MTILDIAAGLALLVAVFCALGLAFLDARRAQRRFIARRIADAVKQIDPDPRPSAINRRRKPT